MITKKQKELWAKCDGKHKSLPELFECKSCSDMLDYKPAAQIAPLDSRMPLRAAVDDAFPRQATPVEIASWRLTYIEDKLNEIVKHLNDVKALLKLRTK